MKRIVYFGSRTWADVPEGWTLREVHTYTRREKRPPWEGPRFKAVEAQAQADLAALGPFVLIEGEADGADILSRIVAVRLGLAFDPYPVDTRIDGPWPAAGHRRNARMHREGKPDEGRCFVSGNIGDAISRGSQGMLDLCGLAGAYVRLVRENGEEEAV